MIPAKGINKNIQNKLSTLANKIGNMDIQDGKCIDTHKQNGINSQLTY